MYGFLFYEENDTYFFNKTELLFPFERIIEVSDSSEIIK